MASGSEAAADALTRASARFVAAIGYSPLAATDDTVTLDGNGTQVLLLPGAPVARVASVTLDGVGLAPTSYGLSTRLGALHRVGGWPFGFGNVVVTYDHGWADIPEDIADAVLEQAEALYRTPAGLAQSAVGPQSVSFNTATGGGAGTTERWAEAVLHHRRSGAMPA